MRFVQNLLIGLAVAGAIALLMIGLGLAGSHPAPRRYYYDTQCPGYPHQVVMRGVCVEVTPR